MAMPPRSADSTPDKRALSWRLEHDVLVAGALRVAVQRIGIGYWQPGIRLRSWGLAPLHREGDTICVPCGAGEALWIGAWLEDGVDAAHVRLRDPSTGGSGSIALPPDGQLTALAEPSRPPRPVMLTAPTSHAMVQPMKLELGLESAGSDAELELLLMTPDEWAARAARTPAAPRVAPPPLPPRLG